MGDDQGDADGSAFGIRKILDCKISNDGRQMYQVEWETTWEPAESLAACQHLVDQFWSHVNNAKSSEHVAIKVRQTIFSSSGMKSIGKLSQDDKTQVHALIQRSAANSGLSTPSEMLATHNPQKRKFEEVKTETAPKPIKSSGASDGLKYIANFTNPYVKLTVVCKVCNKEQSLKHSHHWANHFKVHDKSLCHKCPYCPKTFQYPNVMKKHVDAKHPEMNNVAAPKVENNWNSAAAPKVENNG